MIKRLDTYYTLGVGKNNAATCARTNGGLLQIAFPLSPDQRYQPRCGLWMPTATIVSVSAMSRTESTFLHLSPLENAHVVMMPMLSNIRRLAQDVYPDLPTGFGVE